MPDGDFKHDFDKIILGIDPGTNIMGYGVIGIVKKDFHLISAGIIDLSKYESHPMKLHKIFERVSGLIESYHPDEVALEAPFYGKNVQSMLKLGRAQGVAMAAALNKKLPIFEYEPKKVKQSITGNGNADKLQLAGVLQNLLKFTEMPKHLDATDGLAVALCHYFKSSSPGAGLATGKAGWKAFIAKNPNRVK